MKNLLYLLIFLLSNIAYSQSLSVFDIDTTNFPVMKAKFYAFDKEGKYQTNISTSDFDLFEDGLQRKVINISCPPYHEPKALSTVLTIDISGSMFGPVFQNAQTACKAWINRLPFLKSECAITAFDDNSYLIEDFTNDKNRLLQSLSLLKANGGTNYDAAFWTSKVSALEVANRGNFNKIVVFLSDGIPNTDPQTQQIINIANEYKIVIYCVTLNIAAPQCLKEISARTGGFCFENITTESDAQAIYLKILNIAQDISPCSIEWESEAVCPKNSVNVDFTLKTINENFKSSYILPQIGKAQLVLKPSGIIFWDIPPGSSKDTTIVIKAINSGFNITDIVASNPNFSITPTSFSLLPNESKTLTIKYTPTDSLINFCTFELKNDKCYSSIYVRGGFHHQKNKNSTFKVTHPNGGERFGIGTDTVITWEGCSPEEKVTLDYSIDSGKTYKQISGNASGLKYNWNNIPNTPSNKCLLKATLGERIDTTDEKILGFGSLFHVIYSHDGTKLASCGSGGIFIWDIATGDTILSIREKYVQVHCIAFSPDGNLLASSADNSIKLWNLKTGALIRTFSGHSGYVKCLQFSSDGNKLASGSMDSDIKIWEVNSGSEIYTLSGHTLDVNSISFKSDGSKIASGSDDQTIKIWDVNTGLLINTLTGHSSFVKSVSFSPDGNLIASGSSDQTVKIWDAGTGLLKQVLFVYLLDANSVCFSPDGKIIACGLSDSTIKLWEINSGKEISTLNGHSLSVLDVSFNPDGSKLASGSLDNTIKLWDVNLGKEIKTLYGHTDIVCSISFSRDGNIIASGNADNTIKLWDVNTSSEIKTLKGHKDKIRSVCFSIDRKILASGSDDKSIKLWDVSTGAEIRTLTGHSSGVKSVCFNFDGSIIASGSSDRTIKLWDVETGLEIKTLTGNNTDINSLCFNVDGKKIASVSNNSIKLWDVKTGMEITSLLDNTSVNSGVSFSPEGSQLATGNGADIILWDINSGSTIKTFKGHLATVFSLSFNIEGNIIASGSEDATMKFWDVNTGTEIKTFSGHSSWVSSINFSPEGSKIASGSGDGTIRIWNLDRDSSDNDIYDVSDSVWAIIAPQSATKDIDMGKVLVGSVKDSVIQSFIVNLSNFKSRIDSISISGIDEDQFGVVSGMPPYILDANQSKNVEFKFVPSSVGLKTAKIYVYTSVDTVITNIRGEGVIPQLSVENKIIDFGKVSIGTYKDTIEVVTIKNIGNVPFNISNTKHNKPNDVDFTTLSGGGSFTLAPGETHDMNLRFKPQIKGLTNGTLDFEYNGVGSPATILLIGEGISSEIGSIELKVDTIKGYPGDVVEAHIILNNKKNIQLPDTTIIKADLSYNSTLLQPLNYPSQKIDETTNKIILDNLHVNKSIGDTLSVVRFKVGLGNAESCDLLLSNGQFIGDSVTISFISGIFKLLGVCPEGGNRLINPSGKINIASIKPNPSDNEIEVKLELVEKNGYKLTIVNSNGQIVKSISKTTMTKGINLEIINVSDLSSGFYNLILQTESERLSKMFLILK